MYVKERPPWARPLGYPWPQYKYKAHKLYCTSQLYIIPLRVMGVKDRIIYGEYATEVGGHRTSPTELAMLTDPSVLR